MPNQQQKLQQQCQEFKEQLVANGLDNDLDNAQLVDGNGISGLQLLTPTIEHPVQLALASVLTDASNEADDTSLLKLLPKVVKIKGSVPTSVPIDANTPRANLQAGMSYAEQSPKQWLNILPNSASPKHLIKFWLSHLYWQVARRTTAEQSHR